jgi:chemotaxis protein histidine kinase CheA
LVIVVKEEYLSKLDSTETRDHSDHVTTPKPKSAAASRILRAVEKSRSGEGSGKGEHADSPAATQQAVVPELAKTSQNEAPQAKAPEQPVQVRPVVEPEDALRSLSENQVAATVVKQVSIASEPAQVTPTVKAPAAESKPKAAQPATPAVAETSAPKVDAKAPAAEAKTASPETTKSKNNKKNHKEAEAPSKSKQEVKPEPVAVATPAPVFEAPVLGMGPNPSQSFWANIPLGLKAVVLIAVIAGVGFGAYKFSGKSGAGEKAGQVSKSKPVFVPMSGVGGWSPNWGGEASKSSGRSISLFRSSAQHADYRIEFEGQIENKAFGWIFRAKDPQNYYAYKVEVVKPGLQALVALARFSVVGGVESQKHYTLLEKPVRPGASFSVRMDARGSEFTTWINDQLIEVWQDNKINTGGVGLFNEKDERAQVRKVQIFEMR